METVNVRNLEQIQELDPRAGGGRLAALVLAALGGTALVIAAVTMAKRSGPPAVNTADPLAALVASAGEAKRDRVSPDHLDARDVTFPKLLSDGTTPTTALAAVKDAEGRLLGQVPSASAIALTPPPATDELPVVPLPAGSLLQATPITTEPKDRLTAMSAKVTSAAAEGDLAPAGSDSGFQIQVASFKDQVDADRFVEELRRRGHSAFRQAAYVPGRGLWHRVRIGPFDSKYAANQYRAKFERTERMSPFVVDPSQVKRAEEARAAKLASRERLSVGGGD
ncbi:MAG: SPOR domain-containing protein [Polyangiaceae bacterium]|nr:SPOR domain-containing protein [Polyangiaceae bacterium]